MCGIAAIVGRKTEDARPRVDRMLDCFPYRGPNDRGIWGEGEVTLGHLRLSIIDTSSAGHEPMASSDGRFLISFNGEIFNYIELREELRRLGSAFRTATDTEVILEAYRHWGMRSLERFNGMWAFLLWDRQERTFFAARDRFGVKPLFYRSEGRVVSFASEMKGLLEGSSRINAPYLFHFFDRRTPLGSNETVFDGIAHLRPAHSLTWKDGTMTIQRYWEPDPVRSRGTYDYSDPIATLRELVTDSVRLRLRSDVPLGVCLSGGVDSSVIAVLLKHLGATPQTFSSIYREPEYSEERYIDAVNAAIGSHAHRITPRWEDFFSILEQMVEHHDEPVRMPGCFSHWHVMQCASGHVTVVLDGQGADEILAGYRDYYPSYLASLFRDILLLRSPIEAMVQFRACIQGLDTHLGGHCDILREGVLRALPVGLRRVMAEEREKTYLFTQEFRSAASPSVIGVPEEEQFLQRFPTILDREMYRQFTETNLPMLLRYEDRNSMAFSLEARVPFLDYRVVEFCEGLHYRYKIHGYVMKWILREAFKDLLPRIVYERKDKKGFPTPTPIWFRGPLRTEVRSRLLGGALFDARMVERGKVRELLDEHETGRADHERTIFRLLTLDLWLRTYHPTLS